MSTLRIVRPVVSVVVLGSALFVSCGDDGNAVPRCADAYAEGRTGASEVEACVNDEGTTMYMGVAFYDCVDGSKVSWNDYAWWSSSDDVAHPHPAGAEKTPPGDVLNACLDTDLYGS